MSHMSPVFLCKIRLPSNTKSVLPISISTDSPSFPSNEVAYESSSPPNTQTRPKSRTYLERAQQHSRWEAIDKETSIEQQTIYKTLHNTGIYEFTCSYCLMSYGMEQCVYS